MENVINITDTTFEINNVDVCFHPENEKKCSFYFSDVLLSYKDQLNPKYPSDVVFAWSNALFNVAWSNILFNEEAERECSLSINFNISDILDNITEGMADFEDEVLPLSFKDKIDSLKADLLAEIARIEKLKFETE